MACRSRARAVMAAVFVAAAVSLSAQSQAPLTTFRASRDVVSIDVIVRDRSGALVRELTAADFEIREDGRLQEILTTGFQEVSVAPPPIEEVTLLQRLGRPTLLAGSPSITPPEIVGRRLVLMLFDLSAMEPDEVQRGVQSGLTFVGTQMTDADLVAVASLTWQLTLLTDFTGDRETLRDVLEGMVSVDISTGDTAGAASAGDAALEAGTSTLALAATDARLRAIRFIADALAPVPQKKALLYFTAGLGNAAQDTPAELRAATTAAARAHMAIYPVDTRGLRVVVPGGAARVASRDGEGLFSGRDVSDQFTELTASQDTMASMASSTGGRMFSGGNDLGDAFTRVQRDTAAYYLLGYSSSNTARDGRFRRVQVRVRREGVRIEARTGYYGERDFANTSRADREAQLEDRLMGPVGASGLEFQASTGWFRTGPDRYRVPISIALPIPASAAPRSRNELDILSAVEDEQGRVLARVRDAARWPAGDVATGTAHVIYETSVTLPPGSYTLKTVVRENTNGETGSIHTAIRVPALPPGSLAVSAPWLRPGSPSEAPSLYVEVYDSRASSGGTTALIASAAFFHEGVRVFETDLSGVAAGESGSPDARAYNLSLMPGTALPAGRYLCQITVVDPASGRFAVMRTDLDVP